MVTGELEYIAEFALSGLLMLWLLVCLILDEMAQPI